MSSLAIQMILAATGPRTLANFTAHCRTPMAAQEHCLHHILKKNAHTAFGRRYGFDDIVSIGEFKKRVPLQNYDTLRPLIQEQMNGQPAQLTSEQPIFFATTSGTTGDPKFIPVTPESRVAKSQLVRLFLYSLYQDHPAVFAGKILSVVSPEIEGYAPCGTPFGSESGHMFRNMPAAMNSLYACPYEVCEIKDYAARYYTILRLAAGQSISLIFSCNPSTIVLLSEQLAAHSASIVRDVRDGTLTCDLRVSHTTRTAIERRLTPDPVRSKELEQAALKRDGVLRPADIWPHLSAVACWKGGTVGQYLERFPKYFPPDLPVRDIGYLSSEHRGSVPLSDKGDGGALAVATNFFEFYPADEERPPKPLDLLTLDELEEGRRYHVYVTTLSGLYRYDMNDILEVVASYERTPMVRFIQKGKGVVSFTGEKLYEHQVLGAVEEALQPMHGQFEFIAAVGEFVGDQPRYAFLIEFDQRPNDPDGRKLVERLDGALCVRNQEYAAKRASLRLGPPIIRLIRPGEFNRYRKELVERGRHDGQFKTLRLTADPGFSQAFQSIGEIAVPSDCLRPKM